LPIVWAWRWDDARGTLIGRLAGEEIVAAIGTNIRGKPIEKCFAPDFCAIVLARYRRVITRPALRHNRGQGFVPAGGSGQGERIALPLASDGVHGDGVLGATVYRLEPNAARDRVTFDHEGDRNDFFALA